MSKQLTPAEEYELLRGLIAKHGYPRLGDMLDIAEQSLHTTSLNLSEATEQARRMANAKGRTIGIVYNRPESHDLFGFVWADAESVDKFAIIRTVNCDGNVEDGPAAAALPVGM